jgi:hypothetical protein
MYTHRNKQALNGFQWDQLMYVSYPLNYASCLLEVIHVNYKRGNMAYRTNHNYQGMDVHVHLCTNFSYIASVTVATTSGT